MTSVILIFKLLRAISHSSSRNVIVVQHNFFGLVDCNLTIGTELGVRLRNLNLSELLPQDLQINVLVFGDDDRTLQNPLTHVGQFKTFFLLCFLCVIATVTFTI